MHTKTTKKILPVVQKNFLRAIILKLVSKQDFKNE